MGAVVILSDDQTMVFPDRHAAGRLLGQYLRQLNFHRPVVVAIPRGGIPVAVEIARQIHGDLDFVLPKKLGAPGNPELAIGAVAEDGSIVLNKELIRSLEISEDYIQQEKQRQLHTIAHKAEKLRRFIEPKSLQGRDVIVTDDGVATGSTLLAGLSLLWKRRPRRLIAAIPVLPYDVISKLSDYTDILVVGIAPVRFRGAVGAYYHDFHQIGDEEVQRIVETSGGRDE